MPIRENRVYNDPAIGAAFSGLAQLFAPPSAQDTAAYAVATAKNAETARLADLYAAGATASERAALTGIQGYGQTPQGFTYQVDQGNMTARRGQDIDSGDRRYGTDKATIASMYGTDVGARTSIANNEADNARVLQLGAMGEQGSSIRSFFQPLNPGQVRPAIPAEIAGRIGLPAIGQTAGAAPVLSSDEVIAAAMGAMPGFAEQAARDKFAPTETQVKGRERERLAEDGSLSSQALVDTILGERSPVEAIGPDGKPVFMTPGAAVRSGAQPAPRSPSTVINTGEASDGKLRGKLDETEGKRLSDMQAAAVTSAGLRQDLELMGRLIDEAPQGPLVGRLAAAFPGFSDAGAAFQSIVQRAAPGLRVEGSGATSDIEFQGMLNSLPALRNRPEANRLIAGMMQAKAEVNIRRGELVTAYQNGEIDASQMRQSLAELNRQSVMSPALRGMIDNVGGGVAPLSPDGPAPEAPPSPGSIVDGHRLKGGDPGDPANWELL